MPSSPLLSSLTTKGPSDHSVPSRHHMPLCSYSSLITTRHSVINICSPTPRQMSTQHPHMTGNEKTLREYLPCLKTADFRAASMVFGSLRPMRRGGRRVIKERDKQSEGRLVGRMPNSQGRHRVTRRVQTAIRALTVVRRALSG